MTTPILLKHPITQILLDSIILKLTSLLRFNIYLQVEMWIAIPKYNMTAPFR